MIIIATNGSKAFYNIKPSTKYKQACITPQLSLPLSTHVLREWCHHNSTLIGEHNSYSVNICSFAYTARSIADLHSNHTEKKIKSLVILVIIVLGLLSVNTVDMAYIALIKNHYECM